MVVKFSDRLYKILKISELWWLKIDTEIIIIVHILIDKVNI